MERFINILIVDSNSNNNQSFAEILKGNGNNVLFASTLEDADSFLESRDIGILLVNIDDSNFDGFQYLKQFTTSKKSPETYKIVIANTETSASKLIKGLKQGASDFIAKPFHPNLVKAKIEVFKKLYFKDLRINQLLTNILPENVLNDLNNFGKFSPRRVDEGIVLFTDFVAFSRISKTINPLELVKELEEYFTKFDEIVERYKLEKIKTIGDSYMALAGVTEDTPRPWIRACLAALEMRDFVSTKKSLAQAMNKDSWDMRIGIHTGPLVAGIIGSKKTSFDVWGDTVNIASRAEHHAAPNTINITDRVAGHVLAYFNLTHIGEVSVKNGGDIDMYTLESLKTRYCLFGEGKIANSLLREKCGLMEMDFENARREILNRLKANLPEELKYHDIKHTLNVEKSAMRIATLEGVKEYDMVLLRTAVLFHDSGFILEYKNNEDIAIKFAKAILPKFGFNVEQIEIISQIINSTKNEVEPVTLLEQIMCDADHDYLGRPDYHAIVKRLRVEMEDHGDEMTDEDWLLYQINYLQNVHKYYTVTSNNIRKSGKELRINDLKKKLEKLTINKDL